MGYNLLVNWVCWGCNPLTNHLLTSWEIQVRVLLPNLFLDPGPTNRGFVCPKKKPFTSLQGAIYIYIYIYILNHKVGPGTSYRWVTGVIAFITLLILLMGIITPYS